MSEAEKQSTDGDSQDVVPGVIIGTARNIDTGEDHLIGGPAIRQGDEVQAIIGLFEDASPSGSKRSKAGSTPNYARNWQTAFGKRTEHN